VTDYVLVVRVVPSDIAKANDMPAPPADLVAMEVEDLLVEVEVVGSEWFIESVAVQSD
jgi:hypothetical protein